MADNIIKLKSIRELLGMRFFIPSYQRGYRWTKQQVTDLLKDIWEFSKKRKNEYEFYCVQPLVVKQMEETDPRLSKETEKKVWYEVIDGQQRLTTIYLILLAMNDAISLGLPSDMFELRYQRTVEGYDFSEYLKNVGNISQVNKSHIEYYHVSSTYFTIKDWLEQNKVNIGDDFCNVLLKYELDNSKPQRDKANNIRFIWYESVDDDPIKVFRRLNSGKIGLTDSELIKALMLNRSNFGKETDDHLKLRQQEIASEWDIIEYTLQNDEFWLFLLNVEESNKYKNTTRIDYIFDLICEQQSLGKYANIGTDEHGTFRYFYEYFHTGENAERVKTCWAKVKNYFQTFQEWYNDLELYHYVGYLVHQGEKLDELFKLWNGNTSKEDFISSLKEKIKGKIKNCNDLSKQYEIDGPAKTTCKPLLLLHNIQTVINQNNQLKAKEEYKLTVFYKFPFHIFKKERWDVEHIDSNTTNVLDKVKDQKEWLKYSVLGAVMNDDLKEKIKSFIQEKDSGILFEELANEIEELSPSSSWTNPEHDKNKVWNFVLLDAGTNRGYGNSIFPAKRRCIIGKDQGKSYIIDDDLKVSMEDGAIAFIPPVTKNVFLKYYNTYVDNLREWNENDATAYKQNILDSLQEFEVIDSSNNQNTENNEQ